MKFALNTVKTTVAAVALAAGSTAATASTITFSLNDFVLGWPNSYVASVGGVDLTVTGYRANGAPAQLDVDLLYVPLVSQPGIGVKSGHNSLATFLDSPMVEDGEYLLLNFSTAVTLNAFTMFDGKFGTNTFKLNGVNTPLSGLPAPVGPFTSFAFKHTTDDFKLMSVTVTPVPEPEAIAMMLAGLGVVGFVAARRKKAA